MNKWLKRALISVTLCMGLFLCADVAVASSAKKKTAKKPPRETSASVKKKEQSVNQEIKSTQQQIDANEAEVKKNLAILNSLEHDITLQKQKVANLQTQHAQISAEIAQCTKNINECEAKLSGLREQYVSVIKKLRVARKKANPLAYIFASKSFYQAWRRMRYFQKFSNWREKREQEIKDQVTQLNQLNARLANGRSRLDANLIGQQQAEKELAAQHAAQDEAVKSLRAHGDALRKHLAAKQAEANALSAQVMTLIAQEQEAARMAEQQRKEAERKAAERKAAEEKLAKERAAKEQAAKEQAAREKAEADRKTLEQQEAATAKKKQKKQESKKISKPKKENKNTAKKDKNKKNQAVTQPADGSSNTGSYAEARGRKPRSTSASETKATSSTKSTTATPATASGFANQKGSLPRPVSGQFSVVNKFGRHSLPDLPDVMFDNPGIDAVVSAGSSAQAVYDGTVSGVYVVSGFSTVVIINHGDYFTVYGNIGNPAVKKGDKVKQGQALGKLMSDSDEGGRTTIHFEVWKGREKLNPEAWIR